MAKTKDGFKVGYTLKCSCCGIRFQIWHEYRNQDQDYGYGICSPCQDYEYIRNRDAVIAAFAKIEARLSPEQLKRAENFTFEQKELVVHKAIEDGILTYRI